MESLEKFTLALMLSLLMMVWGCEGDQNKKTDRQSVENKELTTYNQDIDNDDKLSLNSQSAKSPYEQKNGFDGDTVIVPNFLLTKEYDSFESFKRARQLINLKSIKISQDRKNISYTYDSAERNIRLNKALAEEINTIIISPKEDVFLGYEDSESFSENIYLYSSSGYLLKKIKANIYPSIKFSSNGEFISLANLFGNSFSFYDKNGELLASYPNYQEIIKNKKSPLHLIDISPDQNSFLIYSDKLYLVSFNENEIIWEKDLPRVFGSLFLENSIVLLCKDRSINSKAVIMISKENGEIINEIKNINEVFFNENNKILASKNNKYFEYEIN